MNVARVACRQELARSRGGTEQACRTAVVFPSAAEARIGNAEPNACKRVVTPPPLPSHTVHGGRAMRHRRKGRCMYWLLLPRDFRRATCTGVRVTHGFTAGIPHSSRWWTRRRISRCRRRSPRALGGTLLSHTINGLVNGRSYWFVIYAYRGQPGSYLFPSRSAFSARVQPRTVQFSYYACQQFGDSMPASGVFVDSRRSNRETIAYNACLESKASSGTGAGRASVITSSPKLLTDCDASRESVTNMVYMAVIDLATDVMRATVNNEGKLEKFLSDMWQTIAQQCAARPPSPVTIVGRAVFVPPISNYRVQYLSTMPGSTDPNEVYCPIVRKWLGTCPQCTNTRVQHCTPASCRDVDICTNTRVEHCTPPSCKDVKTCTNTRICDDNGCRWDTICTTKRVCTPETCEFRWDRVCNTVRQCTPETCEWRWDTVCSET